MINIDIDEYTKYSNTNKTYIKILIRLINIGNSMFILIFFKGYQILKR